MTTLQAYKKQLQGRISPRTLVLPRTAQGDYVLGKKKRGFGAGRVNGFGGKLDTGESYYTCAVRELQEESGLIAQELCWVGEVCAYFPLTYPTDKIAQQIYIFTCDNWSGELQETEEMIPVILKPEEIDYADMWPDNALFLPLILSSQEGWKVEVLYSEQDLIIDSLITKS